MSNPTEEQAKPCPANELTEQTWRNLDEIFSHHSPTPPQLYSISRLRSHALAFASAIMSEAPPCADRSAAIRKVRESLMTANAAIVLGGKSV